MERRKSALLTQCQSQKSKLTILTYILIGIVITSGIIMGLALGTNVFGTCGSSEDTQDWTQDTTAFTYSLTIQNDFYTIYYDNTTGDMLFNGTTENSEIGNYLLVSDIISLDNDVIEDIDETYDNNLTEYMMNEPYMHYSVEQLQAIQSGVLMGTMDDESIVEDDLSGVTLSQTFVNKTILIGLIGLIGYDTNTSNQYGCFTGLYEEFGIFNIYTDYEYLEGDHDPSALFEKTITEDMDIILTSIKIITNYNATSDTNYEFPVLQGSINGEDVELSYLPYSLLNNGMDMVI